MAWSTCFVLPAGNTQVPFLVPPSPGLLPKAASEYYKGLQPKKINWPRKNVPLAEELAQGLRHLITFHVTNLRSHSGTISFPGAARVTHEHITRNDPRVLLVVVQILPQIPNTPPKAKFLLYKKVVFKPLNFLNVSRLWKVGSTIGVFVKDRTQRWVPHLKFPLFCF